jgi:hypothetical protein
MDLLLKIDSDPRLKQHSISLMGSPGDPSSAAVAGGFLFMFSPTYLQPGAILVQFLQPDI